MSSERGAELDDLLRPAIAAYQHRKVDCQLDSIRCEYRSRRETWQIELDERILSGHRGKPSMPTDTAMTRSGLVKGPSPRASAKNPARTRACRISNARKVPSVD